MSGATTITFRIGRVVAKRTPCGTQRTRQPLPRGSLRNIRLHPHRLGPEAPTLGGEFLLILGPSIGLYYLVRNRVFPTPTHGEHRPAKHPADVMPGCTEVDAKNSVALFLPVALDVLGEAASLLGCPRVARASGCFASINSQG